VPGRFLGRILRGETRSDAKVSSRASVYLASSVATTLISFVSLPLATRLLGPTNYGVFALATTVAGFGTTLATLGTTFYIGNRFHGGTPDDRRLVVSTLVVRTTLLSAAWAVVALVAMWALKSHVSALRDLPLRGLALVLAAGVLSAPWAVAIDVLTVEGQATWFSISLVVQSVANVVTLLAALYLFDIRILALFVGNLGGAVAAALTALVVLRPYLSLRAGFAHLGQRRFIPMQLLDAVQPLVERFLFANYAGFNELGKYAHSQSYRSLLVQGTNAMSRAVWPITLHEARNDRAFPVTKRAWSAVHLGLAIVSAPLVLFGDHLIATLTNGKLTGAWIFLAPWCLVVIMQSTGKPASGVLYAMGHAGEVAKIGIASNGVVIVALAALVPAFGAPGAVAAILLQALVYRVALQVLGRRQARIPFQDGSAILAAVLVVVLFCIRRYATSDAEALAGVLAASWVVSLVVGRRVVSEIAHTALGGLRRGSTPTVAA
jgi:O-antigen/teichoic acid export membrane protein